MSHNTQHNQDAPMELMYVKCAQCGHWLDVKPGYMHQVSHGLCPTCFESEIRKLDEPDPL